MLYPLTMAIYTWTSGNTIDLILDPSFKHYSTSYVALLLFVLLVIVCSKKDLAIFLRIGSFGVIFIVLLIVFILAMGIISLGSTSFVIGSEPEDIAYTVEDW
jgi:amino acid permease